MHYLFKYRRRFFWRTKKAIGHNLENGTMVVYVEGGGIETIPEWSECSLKLGNDWVVHVKTKQETGTGLNIKLDV